MPLRLRFGATGAAVLSDLLRNHRRSGPPWVFSPVLFHNEMSVLLIILMLTNVIVGLLILPAYIAWARPRFIFGGVAEEDLRKETMAAAIN